MKNIKLILVFLLSLSGISFMTPIPWTEINLEKENEPEFIEAPSSFSAILNCHTDSCKFREIDRIVQDAYEKGRFNGQILYAENGKILYNESFGYANLKDKSPLENQWRFQLASTSKPFTAMAIMKLQEAGKIDINQLVSTYLPDFPYPTVTVRNLLQHRSGIPNYIYVADKHWDYRKPITNNDLTPLLQKYAPRLEFTPGRTFKYCNSNYAYLACIIEAVSGEKFATFLQKNIFTPLNMHHTFVYDYTHPQKDSVVTGYSYSRQRGHYERPNDYLDGVVGDKGIYSTAEDLFLFDRALYDSRFLHPQTIDSVLTPAIPFDQNHVSDYGLGFRIKRQDNDQQLAYHNGWWKGFRTFFIHDYQNKRTLIWLNNRSDITVTPYINSILQYTLENNHTETNNNQEYREDYGSNE